MTQSLVLPPTPHSYATDFPLDCIATVRYQLPTFSAFKSLPSYLSPTDLNIR